MTASCTLRGAVALAVMAVTLGAEASVRAQEVAWPELVKVAETTLDELVAGDYPPVIARFNEKMRAAATEDFLRQTMSSLTSQLGALKARTGTRTEERSGIRLVIIGCEFERARVDAQIAFDVQARIAGLAFRPQAAPAAAYAAPAYVNAAAFKEEDVVVDAGGWPLPGTLSVPSGPAPFPAIVFVHGSGQHDRDETIGPNKPFRDLAWGLASRGIAVLRYEERTREHRQRVGPIVSSTVKEEAIDDAVADVALLRSRPGIRTDRIFVLGHSLGAMVAPRIATADPRISGMVLMAAPVRSLEHLFMPGAGNSTGGEYMQPSHVDAAVINDIVTWLGQRN